MRSKSKADIHSDVRFVAITMIQVYYIKDSPCSTDVCLLRS